MLQCRVSDFERLLNERIEDSYEQWEHETSSPPIGLHFQRSHGLLDFLVDLVFSNDRPQVVQQVGKQYTLRDTVHSEQNCAIQNSETVTKEKND